MHDRTLEIATQFAAGQKAYQLLGRRPMMHRFGFHGLSPLRLADAARGVRDNLLAQARARVALRSMTSSGRRARCFGSVFIENRGVVRIGDEFTVGGRLAAVQVIAEGEGMIGIGDDVTVEYGTTIAARSLVSIGSRVRIGPYSMINDSSLPLRVVSEEPAETRGIMIGDDVWIGASVTILPGVRIGHRAVIAAGSVVQSDVPDDALTAGRPATILRVAGACRPVHMSHARAARFTHSAVRRFTERRSD